MRDGDGEGERHSVSVIFDILYKMEGHLNNLLHHRFALSSLIQTGSGGEGLTLSIL